MARHTTVTLVDDLDGSKADEQVAFAVDGRRYEIDLSAANSAALRDLLARYVSAARRAGGRSPTTAPSGRSAAAREQNQAIRQWAQNQGMKISERGRIPSEVLAAYHGSH